MMDDQHITDQLDAYVLGLLEPAERTAVERHAAECEPCRTALQRERRLAQLLRETAHATPQISRARLQQLMPAPPQRRTPFWERINLGMPRSMQKQFVTLAFVAMLLISTLGLQMFANPRAFSARAYQITTTLTTHTPSATLSAAENGVLTAPAAVATAVASNTAPAQEAAVVDQRALTPEPAPLAATPIANNP